MSTPEKPSRRPRYHGKNPRQFHEKYKELQPEKYTDDVAKVLAAGTTPAGMHRPIMVREILEILAPKPPKIALDCTLGYGGHAIEILKALQPGGRLIGLDVDPVELPKTEARLRSLGFSEDSLVVRRSNFAAIASAVAELSPGGVDIVLADLGVSSMQIDDPARGFTFKTDAPLDMRMNTDRGRTAAQLLLSIDRFSLIQILQENADEPRAEIVAAAIIAARGKRPVKTTAELAKVIHYAYTPFSKRSEIDPDDAVRRVFQALRIAVNDEFGALDALLRSLPACLKPGGRVAILSFHSGEDRRVKAAFRDGMHDGTYSAVSEELIRATGEERRANPRSTSAKLRFAIRA